MLLLLCSSLRAHRPTVRSLGVRINSKESRVVHRNILPRLEAPLPQSVCTAKILRMCCTSHRTSLPPLLSVSPRVRVHLHHQRQPPVIAGWPGVQPSNVSKAQLWCACSSICPYASTGCETHPVPGCSFSSYVGRNWTPSSFPRPVPFAPFAGISELQSKCRRRLLRLRPEVPACPYHLFRLWVQPPVLPLGFPSWCCRDTRQ
uniref:(northern house mosquito) hypothetical protein n=1 Tax=Culex pipiens TaxID=7175 RepID=A0A8D8C0H8_CULPI